MRKLWPSAVVVAVLFALVAFFYKGLLFQSLILGDYDAFVYFYPLRQYAADALKQGRFPLWNPELFLGAPFFANVQNAVLYPLNALFLWMTTPSAYSASTVLHVLIAGASMYLFCRRTLGVTPLPALVGGMTFMLSGFISGQVGHINQLNVSAWLPLLLVTFDEAVRRRSLALAVATGLVGTLQLFAGHTQEWYFSTATLGLLALYRIAVPRPRTECSGLRTQSSVLSPLMRQLSPQSSVLSPLMRLRPLAYMLVAGLVESGLGAVQVLPSLELSQQSIRGGGMAYGEAISFSLPPATALYTLLPAYPETLFSEYVGYVGVIPLVLAGVAALTWARRPITLLMLTLAAVGFSLALGGYNPLYPLLYHWIPGFDFFRVPARWLLVYTFGISGLAGLGAQSALDLARRTDFQLPVPPTAVRRASLLRIGVTALIVAVGIGSAGLLFLMAKPKPGVRDLEVWATLAAMTLGLIGVGSFRRLVGTIALTVIAVVGAAELWVAGGDAPYRHPIPYEAYHPDRTSTAEILAGTGGDASPGRVLSFATDKYEVKETPDYRQQYAWLDHESLFRFLVCMKLSEVLAANIPMEYGLETVDGYDGGILPLRRYAELKALLLPDPGIPADNQLRLNLVYAPQQRFLDLLNVRYILGAKLPDTFIDNVYYDRGISIVLEPGQVERLQRLPDVQTTSIGLLSNTAGAREWENADVAGTLRVTDVSGATYQFPLRIGIETGETPIEDSVSPPPNHRKPRVVPAWDGWDYADANYFVKLSLPTRMRVKELALSSQLSEADLRIRSVTLIDDVGATSASVVLSDRLDRTLFFDTKLYRVRDPFPRAFMVHSSDVREDDAALAALRDPFFTPGKTALLAPSPTARSVLPPAGADVAADRVNFSSYQPEESVLSVSARQDGYLVLLDPFYPGWTAYVDGVRVPVERADFLFRGVYLAAGQHDVVFRYEPQSFQKGLEISLASLALVVIALMAMAVAHRRSASVL